MAGTELTVVGWFATTIIGNIINKARSVLGSNRALQTEIENRLTDLEKNSLPLVDAIFEEASKSPIKNRGLIKWMDNLRNEAYKIRDGLDDLEAKRFRESLKGKNKVTKFGYSTGKYLKTLIFSDSELEAFKSAVDEFCKIFMRLPEFINLLHEHRTTATTEHNNTNRWETSSYLDPDAMIFGRDTEIYFILDIILNCQLVCFPNGNQDERERRESTSEVGREGKFQERGKIKSSEVGREGTSQKKSYIKSSEIAQSKKEKSTESEQNSVCISDWKLPVLPIYGLGGVGKTTIAKIVYNNKEVVEGFDLRVWVYISKKFDVKIIMKNIVESVQGSIATGENLDSLSKQTIKCKLIKTITNKRFFLVLDDVHDHDGIESILSEDLFPILRNGAPGSFVLITTQSEPVAKTIGNMPNIISLDVLEPEWFLLLFKYYAFGELFSFDKESGSSSISCKNNTAKAQLNNLTEVELSDLESIATKIAEKLHGLPLAGRVIGKMLYTKLDKSHWNKTLKSNWWDDESTSREILASLSIGYKDLDPDVQQCFRFCSIFPKHYEFDRNTLVQMWMAHDDDFIQPNLADLYKMETRLEDIGRDRFDKLVERSFFQLTVNDGKYVMHDLIRELAIAVSQKQKFYHVESLHDKIPKVTHHMGIYCDGSYMKEKITLFNPVDTNLKTLILFGNLRDISEQSFCNFVGKSKGLRLLDLSNAKMMPQPSKEKTKSRPRASKHIVSSSNRYMPMLVDNICQLSHLRFLDLSFSDAHFLPNEFCQLYHLQVLDLRGLNFLELPKHMNKLVNLRHLYGSANTLS
ncbi:Disease resistance protein RPS5 [Rhynchospora pubera]|uniref:Disease resistance protein RPS5 n=1 Tax=Rhynchospora pubera TaxID=906938 RepID=A0AAV8BSJ4_9POAL|nr:Disease resistance protein RPS5 [Rhynchospora pubera]